MVYRTQTNYMIIISLKLISSWWHLTPLLNSSDMIALRFFRLQFFTHSVIPPTQPSIFHVTIRCDVRSFLQAAIFLSTLSLDGATVWISSYPPLALLNTFGSELVQMVGFTSYFVRSSDHHIYRWIETILYLWWRYYRQLDTTWNSFIFSVTIGKGFDFIS